MNAHLQTFWAQIRQWPPTSSTVYGASFIVAVGSFALTGSWEAAGLIAGFVSMVCPQDAPAIKSGLDEARKLTTAPVAQ